MKLTAFLLIVGLLTGGVGSISSATPQEPPRYILDPIVVTATRTATEVSRIGSSVEVVTGQELRDSGTATLLEALAMVPGVAIARAGVAGGTGTLFLRGAKGEHLLVLIDGVTVNDPISPGGAFDWSTISVDAIERVEIIKGPQSTLYGSKAIAGVIHIITRAASGEADAHLSVEAGSYHTLNATTGISGELLGTAVRVEVSRRQLGDISTAAEKDGNHETDSWSMWSGALRLQRAMGAGRLDVTLRAGRSRFDVDDSGGPSGDDPNSKGWRADLTGTVSFRINLREGWEQRLLVGASRIHRWGIDPPDEDHPEEHIDSDYRGLTRSLEWHHNVVAGSQRLAAGIVFDRQSGSSRYTSVTHSDVVPESNQSAWALYLQDQLSLGTLALTVGGRIDDYSDYGSQPTYRVAVVAPVAGIRLRASIGTGFRAPSLYQRFSPDYGSEDLEAEKSLAWDAGVEAFLLRRGSASLCFYRQEIEDLIDFVFDPVTSISRYENRSRVHLEGWEAQARLALTGSLGLDGSLTVMEARDEYTGEPLPRRPERTATLSISYRPLSRWSWGLRLRHVGKRIDLVWSERKHLRPVTLADGEISCELNPNITVRLRVRNLTDESPQWVWGYGSRGRAFYLGVLLAR